MSRTIHDTLGVKARALWADWSDPEIPLAIAAEMEANWLRQQALRDGERRQRQRSGHAPQPVDLAALPVTTDAPHVFHAITEDDVRAVLSRLPPGSCGGLSRVVRTVDRSSRVAVLPSVIGGATRGRYERMTATIFVMGWRCDPETLGPLALYFKLVALRTLLHEAAHHFDLTFRREPLTVAQAEAWAERLLDERALAIVLPYIHERYPAEVDAFMDWCERHFSSRLPPGALYAGMAPVRRAFLAAAREVMLGNPARLAFARHMHCAGATLLAREALAKEPESPVALAIAACIAQCDDDDFAAGEAQCRRALAIDPSCAEAWDVLVRGYAIRERWGLAAAACEEALARIPAAAPDAYFRATLKEATEKKPR